MKVPAVLLSLIGPKKKRDKTTKKENEASVDSLAQHSVSGVTDVRK